MCGGVIIQLCGNDCTPSLLSLSLSLSPSLASPSPLFIKWVHRRLLGGSSQRAQGMFKMEAGGRGQHRGTVTDSAIRMWSLWGILVLAGVSFPCALFYYTAGVSNLLSLSGRDLPPLKQASSWRAPETEDLPDSVRALSLKLSCSIIPLRPSFHGPSFSSPGHPIPPLALASSSDARFRLSDLRIIPSSS